MPTNDTIVACRWTMPNSAALAREVAVATSAPAAMNDERRPECIDSVAGSYAVTGTLLARHSQSTTATLGANVTAYDSASQSMLYGLRQAFIAAGSDVVTATARANAALFGMVQRQATMVSFVGIFQLLGVLFVALIPLVLLMKRPKQGGPTAAAH